jgi:ATP-dependent Lon protease
MVSTASKSGLTSTAALGFFGAGFADRVVAQALANTFPDVADRQSRVLLHEMQPHRRVRLSQAETGAGLYRIEISHQPGSGVRILNQPPSPTFRESVKVGEQVLFGQARSLVGDRDPREQEFTVQLRAIDSDRAGAGLGVAVVVALCGSLLGRNSRGGTIVVGSATIGGSIELVRNAAQLAGRQLNDLADDMWTKINIEFYRDVPDAVFKALEE